jgi:hypothetical protein
MVQKTEERGLGDRLYETAQETNDDGTVNVSVRDVFEDGDRIAVEFRTPTGEVRIEHMEFPQRNSEQYKFVRFANDVFGGLENAQEVESLHDDGSWRARADPDDNWALVCPKHERLSRVRSVGSRLQHAAVKSAWAILPLTGLTSMLGLAASVVGFPLYVIGNIVGVTPILTNLSAAQFTVVWAFSMVVFFIASGLLVERVEKYEHRYDD